MINPSIYEVMIESVIPNLSESHHKGQSGRIGVIGGCSEFTGAPYYASISSLKLGADLAYVFCTSDAAGPIKSYSPELIVYPILDSPNAIELLHQHMSKFHSLIIGPGLGRDDKLTSTIHGAITKVRDLEILSILDADAFYFIGKGLHLIKGYKKAILTPNAIEFSRLYKLLFGRDLTDSETDGPALGGKVKAMSSKLDNVTIIRKGPFDCISDGNGYTISDDHGSLRRCGGQGDLLVGSLGTFAFWFHANSNKPESPLKQHQINPFMIAAFAASLFTRKCNKLTFDKLGRTMTTTDMIKNIPQAFESLWPSKFKK